MSPRDAEQSKKRILDAAVKIFAVKTFEGARVDDIAEKAGVNKALIYYYFKSKRNLLDTIIKSFLDQGIDQIFSVEEAIFRIDSKNKTELYKAIERFYDYLESKKDILIIIMVESLIQGGPNPLLEIVERYKGQKIEEIKKEMKKKGLTFHQDEVTWLVSELFTGLLPSIMFAILNEELSQHMKVDKRVLLKKFIESLEMTHFRSHLQ